MMVQQPCPPLGRDPVLDRDVAAELTGDPGTGTASQPHGTPGSGCVLDASQ